MTEELDSEDLFIGYVNSANGEDKNFVEVSERRDGLCALNIYNEDVRAEVKLTAPQATALAKYLLDYATGTRL